MRTNLEKWNYYKSQLDDINDRFIEGYFNGKQIPTVFYEIASWRAIRQKNITKIKVSIKTPFFNKKPSKKNIAALVEILNNYKPDEDNIYLYYEYNHDNWKASGAEKLSTVANSDRMSFNREELIPKFEEIKKLYAPRDGCEPCRYCGKQVKKEDLISAKIISYHNWPDTGCRTFFYCSGKCAGYDQMAHEG